MSFNIASCVYNIPTKFGKRLNLANAADGSDTIVAIVQAIKTLTETYEFEELKYQTPVPPLTTLNLTAGQPVVSISALLATIPSNSANYPQFQNQNIIDITDIYVFWMWFASGVNQAGRTLDYRRVPTVDQDSYGITSNTQGAIGTAPPVYFTRFGSVLQVGPAPDNNYQYFVRMKLRHPFPVTEPFVPAILTPTVAGGAITGVSVSNGGTGYQASVTNIPILFNTPVSGVAATGTATTNGSGVVTGVTVATGGSGYVASQATAQTMAIASQQVFVMDSWQEIIEYYACMNLATWEGAQEYVEMFDGILKSKGVDVQQAREARSQMRRDERHNSRALSLRLGSPYTFARR
jgi:hypothetical protein